MSHQNTQNICFFNTTTFWGGGEKWHFDTACLAQQNGHRVFFVCSPNSVLKEKLQEKGIETLTVSNKKLGFLSLRKIRSITRFLKDKQIQSVIFNNPADLKLGGLAAYSAKTPVVVYRRGIAVEVKKKTFTQWLFKKVITHFIFNSNATRALMLKNFSSIIEQKNHQVIYNAIDFPKSKGLTTDNARFVIGNAGRIVAQKAQHYLIEIAKILIAKQLDFEIQIAGEGPKFDALKQLIEEENLSQHITLLGFVKDMDNFMEGIDVFVSTAIWEGFGFVLAEAMTHKKPCLAFNISSNPELIQPNETGFLIPPFQLNVFAEKLLLIANDKDLRKKMGEKAYTFAQLNFEKQKQFEKLISFISS